MSWATQEDIFNTGISVDAEAISCKQEVRCFPVGAATALAHILPKAIRDEQAHWPTAFSGFYLTLAVTCRRFQPHCSVVLSEAFLQFKCRELVIKGLLVNCFIGVLLIKSFYCTLPSLLPAHDFSHKMTSLSSPDLTVLFLSWYSRFCLMRKRSQLCFCGRLWLKPIISHRLGDARQRALCSLYSMLVCLTSPVRVFPYIHSQREGHSGLLN